MKKLLTAVIVTGLLALLSGCAAKTMQDVGTGMQVGAASGTPLAPVVATAGFITEMFGKIMDSENKEPETNNSPDAANIKAGQELMAQQEVYNLYKSRLKPSPDTTSERLKTTAQEVCAEIDKLVADGEGLKMSRERLHKDGYSDILIPKGEKDEFLYPLTKNPVENCTAELEGAGTSFVAMEKYKASSK